jgi:hypothetical protein
MHQLVLASVERCRASRRSNALSAGHRTRSKTGVSNGPLIGQIFIAAFIAFVCLCLFIAHLKQQSRDILPPQPATGLRSHHFFEA